MIAMTTLEKRFPVACLALHLLSRGPLFLYGSGRFWFSLVSQGRHFGINNNKPKEKSASCGRSEALLISPKYSVLQSNTFPTVHNIYLYFSNEAKIYTHPSK